MRGQAYLEPMTLRRIVLFAALTASLIVLLLAGIAASGDQEPPRLGGGQVCTNERVGGAITPC